MRPTKGAQLLYDQGANMNVFQAKPANPLCVMLVPCGSRKTVIPEAIASAVSLPRQPQVSLETAWRDRLSELPATVSASALYSGRGFFLARRASEIAGAPLFIISAGLGLVDAGTTIPSYGLTVAGRGPEAISERSESRFDQVAWWRSVSRGPFATPLATIFESGEDLPVVVALTQPYARMFAPAFETLSAHQQARLRLIGVRLETVLPENLKGQILPYDDRFHSVLPGTLSDFPQRAAYHFVSKCLPELPTGSLHDHKVWVARVLATKQAPIREKRPRMNDDEIVSLIRRRLQTEKGIARLLRLVRDEEGVACEQARFSRLYRQAIEGVHA
jgi:hypothetical protein